MESKIQPNPTGEACLFFEFKRVDKTMQVETPIFVKLPTGKTIQVEIDLTTTNVGQLKHKICQSLAENKTQAYEPNQQILSFSGTSTILTF